jgi:AraC family transcriptional regulator
MSLAAVDLQHGNEKVIDISLKYGYASPTAFNRDSKSIHRITPSQEREEGTMLKGFPLIRFKMTIRGDSEMNYRIEQIIRDIIL